MGSRGSFIAEVAEVKFVSSIAVLARKHAAEPSLKVELGCYYFRRDGKIVGPVIPATVKDSSRPFVAGGVHYTELGFYLCPSSQSYVDLVEKIESPSLEALINSITG